MKAAFAILAVGATAFAGVLPEVQSVSVDGDFVVVKSNGISLKYLGPLQLAPVMDEKVHEYAFRIPRHPLPENGRHARVPVGIMGVFMNGLPIWNQEESISWNGANIWHYDTVRTSNAPKGLLDELPPGSSAPVGYALDGYPIYGPSGMMSSYRLRKIAKRHMLPGGTELTPEQYGPDVTQSTPIGTFAEDYEYVAGSGDLDEFNGRVYEGSYAYFLTSYPYLIGPRYYGKVQARASEEWREIGMGRLKLSMDRLQISAGEAIRFRLEARDAEGERIRHFETIHEKPIHLVIVSEDLKTFAHIHPELTEDDAFEVGYMFPKPGHYRLWADYSLPGEPPHIDTFDVDVVGQALMPAAASQAAMSVTLKTQGPLESNRDVPFTLTLPDTAGLEPYLGAWSHVIVIGQDLKSYAHIHPEETIVKGESTFHTHTVTGPPPSEIHLTANFPNPGRYKLWAQFQLKDDVRSIPFTFEVERAPDRPAESRLRAGLPALQIEITERGYEPSLIRIPANQPVTLAFHRATTTNCGNEIVFPSLNIRKPISPGETVLIDLPSQPAGELTFSCGLGMYRGSMVISAYSSAR